MIALGLPLPEQRKLMLDPIDLAKLALFIQALADLLAVWRADTLSDECLCNVLVVQ